MRCLVIPGTTWCLTHPRAVDGDTIRGTLRRTEYLAGGFAHDVYSARWVDGAWMPWTTSMRLIVVDTPERGEPGYVEASQDVARWLALHPELEVETYETAGWDRLLADVYPVGDRGGTLTQHLLQLGWPIYSRGLPPR